MGRMHSKGLSPSALPRKWIIPPRWLNDIPSQDIVEENICESAKKGLAPKIPEDLYNLIKKAVAIRKHLERNRKDKDSKFSLILYHLVKKAVAIRKHLERNKKEKDSKCRLILVESRIHPLARHYKKTKKLPPDWK